MASPAEITHSLPDTLPEDFNEWDGGGATAAPPADTESHGHAPGLGGASAAPAEHQAAAPAAEPARKAQAPVQAAAQPQPDNKTYQPRLRPVVVDRAPSASAYKPTAVRAADAAHRPAPRPNAVVTDRLRNATPAMATSAMSAADEVLFQTFRASTAEMEDKKKPAGAKNGKMIAVLAAAVVVLLLVIGITMMRRGSSPAVKQPLKPSATAPAQSAATKQAAANAQQPAATEEGPASVPVQSQMMNDQLAAPTRIPQNERTAAGDEAPPTGFNEAGMQGLAGNGGMSNVLGGGSQLKVRAEQPKVVTVSSGVAVGMLVQKTAPVYPAIAKSARVSGTVVLQATISKNGVIEDLQAVSGPTMLRRAALDAVRTWHYKPYLLNGQPTEVQTTINVVFSLTGQ